MAENVDNEPGFEVEDELGELITLDVEDDISASDEGTLLSDELGDIPSLTSESSNETSSDLFVDILDQGNDESPEIIEWLVDAEESASKNDENILDEDLPATALAEEPKSDEEAAQSNDATNESPEIADKLEQLANKIDALNQLIQSRFLENEPHPVSPAKRAIHWYRKGIIAAKEQNHLRAGGHLAKAAMLGHPRAQFYLGILYLHGNGVPQNTIHASAWLQLADTQGVSDAKTALTQANQALSESNLSAAKQLATEWFEKIHWTRITNPL